jgi:hypothetical protein
VRCDFKKNKERGRRLKEIGMRRGARLRLRPRERKRRETQRFRGEEMFVSPAEVKDGYGSSQEFIELGETIDGTERWGREEREK